MSDAQQGTPAEGGMSDAESLWHDDRPFWEGKGLFVTCFVALVATSFAFFIRAYVLEAWQIDFGLSETQKGEISGAGMWTFGPGIIIFSLFVDKIGYKKPLAFAFLCHMVSTLILVTGGSYWMLYIGSCFNGLAAGTVEAVINPVIASMYPRRKTKMLTILHAGWSAGFVVAGALIMILGKMGLGSWRLKVALILIPVIVYGIMLIKSKFPISERVLAGVPYRDMLGEVGAIGCFLVVYMMVMEFNRLLGGGLILDTTFFDIPSIPATIVLVAIVGGYFAYTKSLGRPMYIFLLCIMFLVAITELGTDGWIKELMGPAMKKVGLDAGWVLIYTATIMTALRCCIGPVERALKPLGVLLVSSLLAALGLYFLAAAQGVSILIWATIYGTGQCYFWPVMQGICAEQFPKGGALTMNAIGGMGMLAVGIIGMQLLGFWQDTKIDATVSGKAAPAVYDRLMADEAKESIFGTYRSLDQEYTAQLRYALMIREAQEGGAVLQDPEFQVLVQNLYSKVFPGGTATDVNACMTALQQAGLVPLTGDKLTRFQADTNVVEAARTVGKRYAMQMVAILPLIMACCYFGLIMYFRGKGGYKVVDIVHGGGGGTEVPPAAA